MPIGVRLAWAIRASPGEVQRPPVMDMAAWCWINSSRLVRMVGPKSAGFRSVWDNFLEQNHRSAAYVIFGTATTLYSLRALFIIILDAVLVNRLKAMVHLTAFSRTFSWCAVHVSLESSITPRSFALGLGLTLTVFRSLPWVYLRTRILSLSAFPCDIVKLTSVSLFISSGEL